MWLLWFNRLSGMLALLFLRDRFVGLPMKLISIKEWDLIFPFNFCSLGTANVVPNSVIRLMWTGGNIIGSSCLLSGLAIPSFCLLTTRAWRPELFTIDFTALVIRRGDRGSGTTGIFPFIDAISSSISPQRSVSSSSSDGTLKSDRRRWSLGIVVDGLRPPLDARSFSSVFAAPFATNTSKTCEVGTLYMERVCAWLGRLSRWDKKIRSESSELPCAEKANLLILWHDIGYDRQRKSNSA